MRILRENTIGLVIDIQERLVPAMEENEQLVENCSKLIQGLQILGLPLLVTQQYTKGLGESIDEIKSLIPDFQYIEKKDFSCYDEPVFAEKLALSGAKKCNYLRNRIACLCVANGYRPESCRLQSGCGIRLCFITLVR